MVEDRGHQERRPQPDHHRPEIEGRGAILGDADERHVDLAALERVDHVRRIADRHQFVRHAEPARELDADVGTPALDLPVLLDREIRQHQHADAELAARGKLARGFGGALRVGAGGKAEHRGSGDEYGSGRRSHAHVRPHDILPRRLNESSK